MADTSVLAAVPQIVVDVGAIAAAGVAVLSFFGIVLAATTKAVKHVVEDVLGGLLAPIKDEVSEVKKDVAEIREQVTTNSGGSLKDAVVRIEEAQTRQIEEGP